MVARVYRRQTKSKKRRNTVKRVGKVMKVTRSMKYRNPIHYFKRTYNLCSANGLILGAGSQNSESFTIASHNDNLVYATGNAGTDNTTYGMLNLNIQLADLPDYTEFTNLFDRYRILGCKVKLRTVATVSEAPSGGANPALGGLIHSVIDYCDTAGIPVNQSGVEFLREYENYKCSNVTHSNGVILQRYFKPRVAMAAYNNTFVGYASQRTWCDTASPTIQHYGLKCLFAMVAPSSGTINNLIIFPEATVYMAFKDVK